MKWLTTWVKYLLWAALYGLAHLSLTQTIFWEIASEDVLVASMLNAGYIVVFIILEKVEIYILKRVKARNAHKEPGRLLRFYYSYMKGPTLKSALYLFYFVILVYATIDTASPGRFSEGFSGYLQSVQYGIILLLAADTFIAHLTKDIADDAAQ